MITNKEVRISVSKILTRKLVYIIALVSMLAMMIPMAVPVSAAPGDYLTMYLLDPVNPNPAAPGVGGLAVDSGFNITGSTVRVIPTTAGATVTSWDILNYGTTGAYIVASATGAPGVAYADVRGQQSDTEISHASIIANLSDGTTISIDKKWAEIDYTVLTSSASDVVVIWNEGDKTFYTPPVSTNDTVWGNFVNKDGLIEPMPVQGVILHWYLVAGSQTIPMAPGFFHTLTNDGVNDVIENLPRATFATFVGDGTYQVTVTDANGSSGLDISSIGEEPIWVVVVPEYPNTSNVEVTPEVISINFWTSEMEKVPQVRWAGEKIVLEKYFGPRYAGALVRFSLENQSPGALEGLQGTQLGNLNNTAQTVWDVVSTGSDAGWARCMLVSEAPGEVDVDLALYNQYGGSSSEPVDPTMTTGSVLNQHGFVVFYLKLESITLSNVVGKREFHNAGDWTPSNPWDPTLDETAQTLNVSQDTLLRARVRGWFEGDNASNRAVKTIDADPNVETGDAEGVMDSDPTNDEDMVLPAGRWVLPDDWARLAGPDWAEQRIHWDIMDTPMDMVGALNAWGPYVDPYTSGPSVADYPVIGPFRPGLEVPTATGYNPMINQTMANTYDDFLNNPLPWTGQKTVVPNGELNWWDAPMPPAKMTFRIEDVAVASDNTTGEAGLAIGSAGYFKDALKSGIYYVMVGGTKVYTNPFYSQMIPAFRWIPWVVNNGGYDWNSWDSNYGPYEFWDIFNRIPNEELPPTTRDGMPRMNDHFPSKIQVYSDNHGEAMVYLNGDYNLNPRLMTPNGHDIPFGATVGSSTVVAMADYPYFRKHAKLVSMPVTKTWTWGGMILGPSNSSSQMILSIGDYTYFPDPATPSTSGTSNKKMVWIWATDRDGLVDGVLGSKVQWSITPGTDAIIPNEDIAGDGINGVSNYQSIDGDTTMQWIGLTDGYLKGTSPTYITAYMGESWMKQPSAAEMEIFNKFWGTGNSYTGDPATAPMLGADGLPLDPNNFVVAAVALLDVTTSEEITVTAIITSPDKGVLVYATNVNFASAYPLDDNILPGDANIDGTVSMADVTAIERIILGLSGPCVQADSNGKDGISMGDVVKTERTILGIK
jgi:hypothetical protein